MDGTSAHERAPWPALVRAVEAAARRTGRVVVHGPWGAGRTTLLEAAAPLLAAPAGRRIVRVHTQPGDERLPLLSVDPILRDAAHAAQAAHTSHAAPPAPTVPPAPGTDPVRARRAAVEFLGAGPGSVLLLDGVQWLDPAGAELLGHCARALPPDRLVILAAERTAGRPAHAVRVLGGHPPVLPLLPAGPEEIAELLAAAGLPARWAPAVTRLTGGHRGLLAPCLRALAETAPPGGRPGPVPQAPTALVAAAEAWLEEVPEEVADTLRIAALAHRPDSELLARAGRAEAEEHLARAHRAGLLTHTDPHEPTPRAPVPARAPAPDAVPDPEADAGPDPVRFAAEAVRAALLATTTGHDRRRAHAALADAVHDPVRSAWHRAKAHTGTDRALAEDTARAAPAARRAGDRPTAARLMAEAARLTPTDRPDLRLERLTETARDAAAAGSVALARRAAEAIAEAGGSPEQRVTALLATADAAGQDMSDTDLLLAEARRAADGDPALLAAIELRCAVRANVLTGDAPLALRHADTAAGLARRTGDPALEAAALTMTARMQRVLGRLDTAPATLAAALSLGVPPHRMGVSNSPQYLAARHAVFDGRPAEARAMLRALLPAARAAGDAESLVDLWRSLAEVEAGLGACAEALHWADAALDLTRTADLSPGPAHYTAALAHAHGGSFTTALHHARHGLDAAREEHDTLHITRNLWLLGAVHLHSGRPREAAAALTDVIAREDLTGALDPGVLRWQADAAEALALDGRTGPARDLLDRTRERVAPTPAHTVVRAALTRAAAVVLHETGAADEAAELLDDAAHVFARCGYPVEEGRTLLTLGRLHRRHRRAAAARTAWEAADALFAAARAEPWQALTAAHLHGLSGRGAAPALTERERRLARLVGEGATNQEAARALFVSVKTVEATLSRIYRKLDVRGRNQLPRALAAAGD
ncbi:AAA family ATPase (plasmid) [Streptomyces sp. BI20]|uniref:helix-turn-helix transcriptional regulator n=1 Tax=Streptomyces sp. BI20 TaxID=3403460 RepID=UPI003C754E48